jgi:DNA processing protein
VAILPSPITDILPQANRDLAAQIVQNNGLLISEYLDKAYSKMELSGRYIERDRLQALFSNGVVLTASYAENDVGHDSGSRHAMAYALNYGIPRAVMYDAQRHQQNPTYDLNRQLIQADKNITIINSRNMAETITQIAATQIAATAPLDSWVQRGLF